MTVLPSGCHDKCATPDVCRLKGCREVRLRDISEEAALQARLVAAQVAPPVMVFDASKIDMERLRVEMQKPGSVMVLSRDELIVDFSAAAVLPNSDYADAIIAQHSTPGLKKNELTRQGKKEQLNSQGMEKFPEDRDKILDQLYPKGK